MSYQTEELKSAIQAALESKRPSVRDALELQLRMLELLKEKQDKGDNYVRLISTNGL